MEERAWFALPRNEDYVSVQDEASGKRMRLKGGIYDEGFDVEKLVRADRGRLARGLEQLAKLEKIGRAVEADSQSQPTSGGGGRDWSLDDEEEKKKREGPSFDR